MKLPKGTVIKFGHDYFHPSYEPIHDNLIDVSEDMIWLMLPTGVGVDVGAYYYNEKSESRDIIRIRVHIDSFDNILSEVSYELIEWQLVLKAIETLSFVWSGGMELIDWRKFQ